MQQSRGTHGGSSLCRATNPGDDRSSRTWRIDHSTVIWLERLTGADRWKNALKVNIPGMGGDVEGKPLYRGSDVEPEDGRPTGIGCWNIAGSVNEQPTSKPYGLVVREEEGRGYSFRFHSLGGGSADTRWSKGAGLGYIEIEHGLLERIAACYEAMVDQLLKGGSDAF